MEPWQSWAVVGVIAAGAGYYYTSSTNQKKLPQLPAGKERQDGRDVRKKDRDRGQLKPVDDDVLEGHNGPLNGTVKNRKKTKKQGNKLQGTKTGEQNSAGEVTRNDGPDDEVDNLEFARQLNSAQVGTSLQKRSGPEVSKKGKKKNKGVQAIPETSNGHIKEPLETSTGPSSTTGPDADDDFSLAASPELVSTSVTTPSAADVSDMLEAPAKGPSVIRLTEPSKPQPDRAPKAPKAASEVETKKQRQRRKKKEEEKAVREETEKERRVLLEKQRRTAREAEGRPAKNGLQGAALPSQSAWNKSSGANGTIAIPPPSSQTAPPTLLDTFEDSQSAATASDNSSSYQQLPSEEEQLRLITEMDGESSWSTVDKGGKAKKKPSPTTTSSSQQPWSAGVAPQQQSLSEAKSAEAAPRIGTQSGTNGINGSASSHTGDTAKGLSSVEKVQTVAESDADAAWERKLAEKRNVTKFPWIYRDQPLVERNRRLAKTLDRSVWNHANIREHPEYDPAWPYALVGHPLDSDWAA